MAAPGFQPDSDLDTLLDLLPHRPPFRFLSHIYNLQPGVTGSAGWIINGDEWFLQGHFPDQPIVPGVLIGEALAQLSGLVGLVPKRGRSAEASAQKMIEARLAHIDLKFADTAVPPVEITMGSNLQRQIGPLRLFWVKARVGPLIVAKGTLVLGEVIVPMGDMTDLDEPL